MPKNWPRRAHEHANVRFPREGNAMTMQRVRQNWLTTHRRQDKLECMLTFITNAYVIKNRMARRRGGPMGACVR
jgi:3-phenylpropionate/cinnamic acid dioxygenase small subunit